MSAICRSSSGAALASRLILDAVDLDGAAEALDDDADAALFVGEEEVGASQRRKHAVEALAGRLMAGGAVDLKQRGTAGGGVFFRSGAATEQGKQGSAGGRKREGSHRCWVKEWRGGSNHYADGAQQWAWLRAESFS